MKRIINIVIPLLLSSLLSVTLSAQTSETDIQTINSRLESYSLSNPFEELYLHTDREAYSAGEAVRIKAYLLSYPDLRLADKETYAYAEVLDWFNRPVAQVTLSLENGTGEGVLFLPDTLATGSFFLRAYTSVMRNYMPHGCFMKRLTVVNPFSTRYIDFLTDRKFRNDPPAHVIFMPGGGSLINGIENETGIVTLNKYGYPVSCKGRVINDSARVITDVITDTTGIGSLRFVPEKGEQYFFETDGGYQRYTLPTALDAGIALEVSGTETERIHISLKYKNEDGSGGYLAGMIVIRSGGRIRYSEKLTSWQREFNASIPVNILATGINDIVIFDAGGNVLYERFIFIPQQAGRSTAINTATPPGKRKKIRIEIGDAETGNGSLSGSISVSAPSPGRPALLATEYLMLGSEIRLPADAFSLRETFPYLTNDAKNILLLGAKSNRIDWKKLMSGSVGPSFFPEEKEGRFLFVSLPERDSLAPGENVKAWLTSYGQTPSFQYAAGDSTGRFVFYLEKKNNPDDLIIRVDNGGVSQPLKIESRFSDMYITREFIADTTYMKTGVATERLLAGYQLRKIYGISDTASIDQSHGEERQPVPFYDKPDQELFLDDYISLSSMREIFFELIKRLSVRAGRKDQGDVIYDPILKRSPSLFVDMVLVDDAETLLNINPAYVKKIDVITGDYMVGDVVFPGIVSVFTRKGNFTDARLPSNSVRMPWRMYDPRKAFITPDYSTVDGINSRQPDFRNTLYWSGSLNRDDNGSIYYEFWSSDDSQDYEVSFNVITDTGEIISARGTLSLTGIL